MGIAISIQGTIMKLYAFVSTRSHFLTFISNSNRAIPTIMGESVESEITTDGCAGTSAEVRYLEHVQARVSLRFLPRGNINIKLVSPSGNFYYCDSTILAL